MIAGGLKFETKLETKDFEKNLNNVSSLSIAKGQIMANVFMKVADTMKTVALNGIKYNATIEQLTASFKTMTGSSSEAVKIVERLKKVGSETPYELTGLAETTQLLMQYGLNSEQAYKATLSFGDIAQGSAEKMYSIALAYGQMSSYGKVTLVDIKQMITAGFNPLQEISETTGESMQSLYDRISDGTLAVDEITNAMTRSSAEGGKFFNSMENQSKTFNGQMSTLKDTWNSFTGEMMDSLSSKLATDVLPKLNEFVSYLTDKISGKEVKELSTETNLLIASLATLTTGIATFSAYLGVVKAVNTLKTGLIALNAVMLANPIGIVIALIAALVVGIVYLYNTSDEFKNFWDWLWQSIVDYFKWQIDTVIGIFDGIVNYFKWQISTITTLFDNLKTGIGNAINIIVEVFTNLPYYIGLVIGTLIGMFIDMYMNIHKLFYEDIPNAVIYLINKFQEFKTFMINLIFNLIEYFKTLPDRIREILLTTGISIYNWVLDIKSIMETGIKNIIDNVISSFKELPGQIVVIGKQIVEGIWNGIINAKDWLYHKVKEFSNEILKGIKDGLGIKSPSTKARDLAKYVPQGFAIGIEADTDTALKSVDKMNDSILNKMRMAVNKQTGFAGFAGISGNVSEILSANSVIRVENYNTLELDGEQIYNNQQTISKNKNLQYAFGG